VSVGGTRGYGAARGANKCHNSNVAMENYDYVAFVPRVPGVTVAAGHGSRNGRPFLSV